MKGRPLSKKIILLSVFIALTVVLPSCRSSADLTNEWRDPGYKREPLKSIIVVAMKTNPAVRRIWEDGFVSELSRHGINAVPSYEQYPNKLPDTSQVLDAIATYHYDGMLLANRISTDTTQTRVRGYYAPEQFDMYNPWTNWYNTYYADVYHPGYVETQRNVRHEVNVWLTGSRKLVWSGTAIVVDPTSSKDINSQIVNAVVPELAKQGIIPEEK